MRPALHLLEPAAGHAPEFVEALVGKEEFLQSHTS
jgi:hypothetical protein